MRLQAHRGAVQRRPHRRPDRPAPTVAQRIAAHGWKVIKTADGYVVPLTQPERGLIPLLLDGEGVEKLVDGERIYPTLTGRRTAR